jgi:hypothetical protein
VVSPSPSPSLSLRYSMHFSPPPLSMMYIIILLNN